ncbi:3-deoxy-manno-octulosonate cytidylyltransferase [Magnetospirillum sulfuroxidans]|uniref:3-deoxy-manno-octulosonate cytidylyltransferase n=1 Tax=Magnetospirillum sulfuroxidans TaxID=611300 RepID=A0ABS5IGY3_9PROT|nr:3-deoxy-manno-octulosonate cytidylyltransferase [Magnetospirillum sulfuroxidans]MBR9973690.1 3-deoxy-manno-octulosonate cytidylyltransferase [Magnetospirillum sulfuroxidans]
MKTVGVIPCRYKSVRFPGKPLADILGKPMMWHVYQQALKARTLDALYIATDDERIAAVCRELDLLVLMTGDNHSTGTDRVAECRDMVVADVYVNIQGDEPMIDPSAIDLVVNAIKQCDDPAVMASNAYTPISNPSDAVDTNIVKVSLTAAGNTMAYSRSPIPFPKSGEVRYLRQLGLYAFRRSGLLIFSEHQPGPVERAEGVEMLRFIEHGYHVKMVEVHDESLSVDTESDLHRVRALMGAQVGQPQL